MNKKQIVEHARSIMRYGIVIDTETTGLGETDVVIEVAAVRASTGEVLMDELIKTDLPLNPEAQAVNKITPEMLAEHGQYADIILPELLVCSTGHAGFLTSFNVPFDSRLIAQSWIAANQLEGDSLAKVHNEVQECFGPCIMELANRYFHEHLQWSYNGSCFKRLSLARCMEIAGLKFKGDPHRALCDTLAARDLIQFIAEDGLSNGANNGIKLRASARDKITADTEAFLKKGGEIKAPPYSPEVNEKLTAERQIKRFAEARKRAESSDCWKKKSQDGYTTRKTKVSK